MTYPTMVKGGSLLYVSEEELDGTPDFIVERWGVGNWRVKWRTSQGWSGPYKTKKEAFESVKERSK